MSLISALDDKREKSKISRIFTVLPCRAFLLSPVGAVFVPTLTPLVIAPKICNGVDRPLGHCVQASIIPVFIFLLDSPEQSAPSAKHRGRAVSSSVANSKPKKARYEENELNTS